MRILICCNIYPPNFIGGAELIAHFQGKHLVAAGHEVHVFAGDVRPVGLRHQLRTEQYEGITVHRVNLNGMDYQSDFVNFSHPPVEQLFSKLLEEFRPHVVHCHNIIGLSVTILQIAREFGAKVVMTLHDHWGFCFKNTIMKDAGVTCTDYSRCDECQPYIEDGNNRRLPMRMRQDYMKLAMNAVDVFVSPSQYLANTYIAAGFPSRKMHVVWNGIDVDRFSAIQRNFAPEVLRFSFFGYFGKHKGIHTLLEALPLLKDRRKVRINLIGDGDQRVEYEQQLYKNGCSDLVKFWGKLDNNDVARAYAETDVLVLPSIWRENQPVSITEAMACGIPVIGSDMGGIPELVENGVSGYIFEAGNAVDLAEKMDRLIADRPLVTAMGLNGQKKMRGNSFAPQVEKLLSLYLAKSDRRPSESDDILVIACIGHRVDNDCAQAMARLTHYLGGTQPYMLMAEWLTEFQLQQASLAWVVDATATPENITKLAYSGLPLLVPEQNGNLLETCRKYQCGLYYRDADEAAACIAYMLTHEQDRADLAHNTRVACHGGMNR